MGAGASAHPSEAAFASSLREDGASPGKLDAAKMKSDRTAMFRRFKKVYEANKLEKDDEEMTELMDAEVKAQSAWVSLSRGLDQIRHERRVLGAIVNADVESPAPIAALPAEPPAGDAAPEPTEEEMQGHRERCQMLVRQMSRQAGFNFVVATDGSKGAHLAFLGAMALRKGEGCVQMLHIADPSVEVKDLDFEKQPENIRQRYEIELVPKISQERYKWTLLWKPDKYDIKQTIVAAMNQVEQHVVDQFDYGSFFVCGWVQEDGAIEGAPPSVLGSSTDLCLRQMGMPVVIMKHALAPKERTFVVCMDRGPVAAWKAYALTTQIMKANDKLVLLKIYEPDVEVTLSADEQIPALRAKFEDDIESRGINGQFTMLDNAPGTPKVETMIEWVKDNLPDFVVLCPRPDLTLANRGVSFAEKAVHDLSKTNFILIKY